MSWRVSSKAALDPGGGLKGYGRLPSEESGLGSSSRPELLNLAIVPKLHKEPAMSASRLQLWLSLALALIVTTQVGWGGGMRRLDPTNVGGVTTLVSWGGGSTE